MRMALEAVYRHEDDLTSRPRRGALQVAAIEPNTVQALRVMRSIHVQSSASVKMIEFLRISTIVQGYAGKSQIAKVVMSACGNALPIASQSTTRKPRMAPARHG